MNKRLFCLCIILLFYSQCSTYKKKYYSSSFGFNSTIAYRTNGFKPNKKDLCFLTVYANQLIRPEDSNNVIILISKKYLTEKESAHCKRLNALKYALIDKYGIDTSKILLFKGLDISEKVPYNINKKLAFVSIILKEKGGTYNKLGPSHDELSLIITDTFLLKCPLNDFK